MEEPLAKRRANPNQAHCIYCGVPLSKGKNKSVDHFVPVSNGGRGLKNNKVPSCKSCNFLKADRVFESIDKARQWIFNECERIAKRIRKNGIPRS